MEYTKSEWDFILWPRTWHKRLNAMAVTLVPGMIVVGLFDMLVVPQSILIDFLLPGGPGIALKVLLFVFLAAMIGFLDVFCFAWPIADFCRYLARRSEKFISPGFNIIFMKSYAYSHGFFLPLILFNNPTGFQIDDLGAGTSFFIRIVIWIFVMMAYTQLFWQLGIMLRTISVKSKIALSGKLFATIVMFFWSSFTGQAVYYLIHLAYRLFEAIEKVT